MEKTIVYRERLEWIDIAKGIAILLVVIGHMLRGFMASGLYGQYSNEMGYIDFTIYSFHMPLFFIISGVLYKKSMKISTFKEMCNFIKKKLVYIMIPYFICSWIQIGIKLVMSGSVNSEVSIKNLFTIIYKPIEQFWFLYALMCIFIIVSFVSYIESSRKFKIINFKYVKLTIVFFIFILGRIIQSNIEIIGQILSNLMYFFIGTIIFEKIDKGQKKYITNNKKYKVNRVKRNLMYRNEKIESNIIICISLGIYLLLYGFVYRKSLFLNDKLHEFLLFIIGELIMAIMASVTIIQICRRVQFKEWLIVKLFKLLGENSLNIYLLHIIFGAGIRVVLCKIGITSLVIHSVFGILFGILIPISLKYLYISFNIDKKDICNIEAV